MAVEGLASGGITITWTHLGEADADAKNEIQIAGPFTSPARVAIGSRFRFKAVVIGTTLTYEATGLQPGAWYWVRVRYIEDNGEITNWVADQSTSKA
jgi:hypothetical protein